MKNVFKLLIAISIILLIVIILASCKNKLHISKEQRNKNIIEQNDGEKVYSVSNEIRIAIDSDTEWDELFLSKRFKDKYKNKHGIIDDLSNVESINCGEDIIDGENIVIIFVNKKGAIFDADETDSITNVYKFKYKLDDNKDIDDLFLIEKKNTYTMTGKDVEDRR